MHTRIHTYTHTHTYTHIHTHTVLHSWHLCGTHRTTCGKQLSPFTVTVPVIELRSSGVVARAFTCWADSRAPLFLSFLSECHSKSLSNNFKINEKLMNFLYSLFLNHWKCSSGLGQLSDHSIPPIHLSVSHPTQPLHSALGANMNNKI